MRYHLVAFITVAIWGTTFVWTKLLIANGLSPAQIFTLRFLLAYTLMLVFTVAMRRRKPIRWMADGWRNELLMVALGITGGSLYFYTENEALRFTTATNTSLIVCSCPLFTMLAARLLFRSERLKARQVLGSFIAFAGMAVVVLNGRFVLHLSPVGDALAFAACICWAVYSLLMKVVADRYSPMFLTRKVFFYGLLTILPYYLYDPAMPSLEVLFRPQVVANVLFLGCVASMACFLTWNWALAHLGAVKCTNWVYLNPITTMIFASIVLAEQITLYFLFGSALLLVGMYLAEKKSVGLRR